MEVELNDKTYPFIFKDDAQINGEIEIFLEDDDDIPFIKSWVNQMYDQETFKINPKVEFIKDIKFTTTTQKGMLCACYPILRQNEKSVIIHFDYKHIIW